MRKWIPVLLIGLAFLWFILTNVGYSTALTDIASRPIVALTKDDTRVPVQPSGKAPLPGEARGLGGQGVAFGLSLSFALPDGAIITCTQRFSRLGCDGGWTAVRAP